MQASTLRWKKTGCDPHDPEFVWVEGGGDDDEFKLRVTAADIDDAWFVSETNEWSKVDVSDVVSGARDGGGIYVVTLQALQGDLTLLWLRTALEMLRTNIVNLKRHLDANEKMMSSWC